jgi:hypothetical protein
MYTSLMKYLVAAMIIAVVASCAQQQQQTETVKLYEDPSRVQKPYERLLIVDVSTDRAMQEQFEDEIVLGLRRAGVDAVPSHSRLDASDGILQEDINRLSDELGTDGILITHIASLDTTMDLEKGREEILSTCRGGNPVDFFLYDREILTEPDSIKVAHTVVVVTNLYDAESRERVWSIQSTCFEKTSIAEVLLDETKAIVRQLRIDKLI